MKYDKDLVAYKLIQWEAYLQNYHLPEWKEIPDIGLYMDQVIALLSHYLNFIPPSQPDERPITPTTINNYVRLKVMPPPEKRKYHRTHIAYLIVIFTLKQSVSISSVQQMLPADLPCEDIQRFYEEYRSLVSEVSTSFTRQARVAAQAILDPDQRDEDAHAIRAFILKSMLAAGLSGILAEKLLLLQGVNREEVLACETPQAE